MKKLFILLGVILVFVFIVASVGEKPMSSAPSDTSPEQTLSSSVQTADFGRIPLYFIPNEGQVDFQALYYARTSWGKLWLIRNGLVFDGIHRVESRDRRSNQKAALQRKVIEDLGEPLGEKASPEYTRMAFKKDVSRLIFLDANEATEIVPAEPAAYRVNYFKGNDPEKWQTDIPASHAVLYSNLYNGIDLKIYGKEWRIEYDWVIRPGAKVEDIRFAYEEAESHIDAGGDLVVKTSLGIYIHKKPDTYQIIAGEKVTVEAAFKALDTGGYGFEVGPYDETQNLVIDPLVLVYSTYLGGSDWDKACGIAVDGLGCVYISGCTVSPDFPTLNPYQTDQLNVDIFVTKFAADGQSLVYSTYFGGTSNDFVYGCAIDSSGAAYVTGETRSTDLPTKNAFQGSYGGGNFYGDAFVTKFSSSGSSLEYSTYLGGWGWEWAQAIAVDDAGVAYITGWTNSSDFPVHNAYQATAPGGYYYFDAFVTKLAATGSSLIYSTFLGGSTDDDIGCGIAADSAGSAYVIGKTESTDFPTQNPFQVAHGGGEVDVFITKFSPDGLSLIYSSYLGGAGRDFPYDIDVPSSGTAFITGLTESTDFPTINPYQGIKASSNDDAFITKIAANGQSLLYSTYLGGTGDDGGSGIKIHSGGTIYVTGCTLSDDFPLKDAYQDTLSAGDLFITKFRADGQSLVFSTYLGGTSYDSSSYGMDVDSQGAAYVGGTTYSTDFPTKNPYQTDQSGEDAFVSKLILPVQKDDLLGTWNTQGVYYRNSDTGSWVMMASPASQIAAGDINHDGIDDLVGIWPGQGGVWIKYSISGSWALLSSTADWIGSGDMNGDGLCDLLGTWTGQGVYYRNSANGQWVKMATPATQITAGDLDDDGTDDLVGIWPAQGGVWVKYSSSESWSRLSSTADWIACGDMNGDGRDDLLGTWAGQGVYYKDSATDSWIKMATPATQIAAGDLDGNGIDDLLGIWPGQGGVWVKYSGDETWERLSTTADWITCGKMRSADASSTELALTAPIGGIAQGPGWSERNEDLSSQGPGGWKFIYEEEDNLIPHEQRRLRIMRVPGPGESGFRCIEQNNLVPIEGIKTERARKKK